jgi:hypothetical protein
MLEANFGHRPPEAGCTSIVPALNTAIDIDAKQTKRKRAASPFALDTLIPLIPDQTESTRHRRMKNTPKNWNPTIVVIPMSTTWRPVKGTKASVVHIKDRRPRTNRMSAAGIRM